jgi:23S rRNA-/tRNA-specific pseudouridylate synthase
LIEKYPPSTVLEGDLFRVYLFPRRFPECMIDYTFRVIWENDDLLLVDKPPGCPCSLHVSNALEALDVAASASLGINLIRWVNTEKHGAIFLN